VAGGIILLLPIPLKPPMSEVVMNTYLGHDVGGPSMPPKLEGVHWNSHKSTLSSRECDDPKQWA